jgi:cyclopropane-fatty-acyl-phospholipid synthase
MLDPRMTYTCGYWQDAADLASAQEAKLELICRKLDLRPGMHLLDIGCGWGSLLGYAAEHHGVRGTGVTVSREQAEWAQQRYAGLPVEFRLHLRPRGQRRHVRTRRPAQLPHLHAGGAARTGA